MAQSLSLLAASSGTEPRSPTLVGQKGELLAADYLEANGYRIVVTNFKVPVGRNSIGAQVTGEIDIVALEGETLCFVEVKTRVSRDFAEPTAAVDRRKQRQITRTANIYRRIFDVVETPHRYDVVSIVLGHLDDPSIELIKGFWSESSFNKRRWVNDIW